MHSKWPKTEFYVVYKYFIYLIFQQSRHFLDLGSCWLTSTSDNMVKCDWGLLMVENHASWIVQPTKHIQKLCVVLHTKVCPARAEVRSSPLPHHCIKKICKMQKWKWKLRQFYLLPEQSEWWCSFNSRWQSVMTINGFTLINRQKTILTWRTDRRVRSLQPFEALICETMCQTPPGNDRRLHAKIRVSARVTLISRTDARSATFQTNQVQNTCKLWNV